MSNNSFRPAGNTVLLSISTSTSIGPTQINANNMSAIYVANNSTNGAYLAFGSSSAPAASVPTTSGAIGIALLAGASRVFTLGPTSSNTGWLSACTSAGTASLYATPGVGQ